MGRLDGKVAVITGAGGGIGREATLLFSEEGASVCVADVAEDQGQQTATDAREAFFQKVDVADPESVQEMYRATVERYGGVDILYNNAGIMPADDSSVLETEVDAWQRVQDVNTKGVYLCCKHGIPHLLARGGGRRDLADFLHGLEGSCAVHEPRAGSRIRTPGSARERALSRPRGDAVAHAPPQ
jgi:NAD(P)-dependent dehydrogenase (short-subunit alcohol dehydrogenase family)